MPLMLACKNKVRFSHVSAQTPLNIDNVLLVAYILMFCVTS